MQPYDITYLFVNLNILSTIKEGQKINVANPIFKIEKINSAKKSLLRTIYGESRHKSLKKIQELIEGCIYHSNNAINLYIFKSNTGILKDISKNELSQGVELSEWDSYRKDKLNIDNLSFLKDLKVALNSSIIGIEELKKTYKNDTSFIYELDVQINIIKRTVQNLTTFLNDLEDLNQ